MNFVVYYEDTTEIDYVRIFGPFTEAAARKFFKVLLKRDLAANDELEINQDWSASDRVHLSPKTRFKENYSDDPVITIKLMDLEPRF